MTAINVAVRVRPLNKREVALGDKCIVAMEGPTTTLTDPSTHEQDKFVFDYSYWSVDSTSAHSANQETVMHDLGRLYLEAAFQGYNSSIFAYGQTGSGKSFSMMGTSDDPGIIPLGCREMFMRMSTEHDAEIEVEVSYLEIYNEAVRDLLSPSPTSKKKKGLRIRESPTVGVYVQDLKKLVAEDYAAVEHYLQLGQQSRTIAETKMNATSSRSHSVFTIYFTQTTRRSGRETKKSSKVNLVDLAGSERQEKTGASGARLKEACAINKSLSALGNVIAALAHNAGGGSNPKRFRKKFVPYRDSVLTRLLQESLGGNAKTIMIAAISPASSNYDETLSTLRFADRVKKIKNIPRVNQDSQEALINSLQGEVARLEELLAEQSNSPGGGGADEADLKDLKETIEAQNELITEMKMTSREKKNKTKELLDLRKEALADSRLTANELTSLLGTEAGTPHLLNMHADMTLNSSLIYMLNKGTTSVGRKEGSTICLEGVSIAPEHCFLAWDGKEVTIAPVDGVTFVNGEKLSRRRRLESGDRVLFGKAFFLRFFESAEHSEDSFTFEDAIQEAALALGWAVTPVDPGNGSARGKVAMTDLDQFHQRVVHAVALADQATDMARELGKETAFAVDLRSEEGRMSASEQRVAIRCSSLRPGCPASRVVPLEDFEGRVDEMHEMHKAFLRGEEIDVHPNDDPFLEYPDDIVIGEAKIPLKSLAALGTVHTKMECREKGVFVKVKIVPRDAVSIGAPRLRPCEDSTEIVNKHVRFVLCVEQVFGVPDRLQNGVFVQCEGFPEISSVFVTERSEESETDAPRFADDKMACDVTLDPVMAEYLRSAYLRVVVMGRPRDGADEAEYLRVRGQRDEALLLAEQLQRELEESKRGREAERARLVAALQEQQEEEAENEHAAREAAARERSSHAREGDLKALRTSVRVLNDQLSLLERSTTQMAERRKAAEQAEKRTAQEYRAFEAGANEEKAKLALSVDKCKAQIMHLQHEIDEMEKKHNKSKTCAVL